MLRCLFILRKVEEEEAWVHKRTARVRRNEQGQMPLVHACRAHGEGVS